MSKVVYILGAGFNCSILDSSNGLRAPLANNFFQSYFSSSFLDSDLISSSIQNQTRILFDEIERYWHLNEDDLKEKPLDIEECLTLFESLINDERDDERDDERKDRLKISAVTLRSLLLKYLNRLGGIETEEVTSNLGHFLSTQFGEDVLSNNADVITFNYDLLAESCIERASKVRGDSKSYELVLDSTGIGKSLNSKIPFEGLEASHFNWNRTLSYGFKFDKITLPVAGLPVYVEGNRFYSHPKNQLYNKTRVLKLHGSIDWLAQTNFKSYPIDVSDENKIISENEILLDYKVEYNLGASLLPSIRGWVMDPYIIPPVLYKKFNEPPFNHLWETAKNTLSDCRKLIVVGYSFPPTDFRTKRLFLEAFSNHDLDELIVINPDKKVEEIIVRLTNFKGKSRIFNDLNEYFFEKSI